MSVFTGTFSNSAMVTISTTEVFTNSLNRTMKASLSGGLTRMLWENDH